MINLAACFVSCLLLATNPKLSTCYGCRLLLATDYAPTFLLSFVCYLLQTTCCCFLSFFLSRSSCCDFLPLSCFQENSPCYLPTVFFSFTRPLIELSSDTMLRISPFPTPNSHPQTPIKILRRLIHWCYIKRKETENTLYKASLLPYLYY